MGQRSATAGAPTCQVLIGPATQPGAAITAFVQPVGCGLVVQAGERPLVLTCAHVVNAALQRETAAAATPDETVAVWPWA